MGQRPEAAKPSSTSLLSLDQDLSTALCLHQPAELCLDPQVASTNWYSGTDGLVPSPRGDHCLCLCMGCPLDKADPKA